jgi:hypothetical protein
MMRLIFIAALALLGCDAAPTAAPAQDERWMCHTHGAVSQRVLMSACDGLACPAVTIAGDTIAVRSEDITTGEVCR